MKTSKQARRDAKALYRSCLVDDRLDGSRVQDIVRRVLEARPRGWLPALTHFQRLVKLELDRRTARVESPGALDSGLRDQLKRKLEDLYGPGLQFEFVENRNLLGGLRVRVGSDVFDGSVEARLASLEESF